MLGHIVPESRWKRLGSWDGKNYPIHHTPLAPSDFYLFRSLEHYLRDKTFSNDNDVNFGLHSFFASKDSHYFRSGIERLECRWKTVVNNDGEHIID